MILPIGYCSELAQLALNGKTAFQALQVYIVDARLVPEYYEGYFLALPWDKGYFFNSLNDAFYFQYQAIAARGRTGIGCLGKNINNLTRFDPARDNLQVPDKRRDWNRLYRCLKYSYRSWAFSYYGRG